MNSSLITTAIISLLSLNIQGSEVSDFGKQLALSVSRGAVEVRTNKNIENSSDVQEIIIQINNSNEVFDAPILVFTDDEIKVLDANKLNEVLSKTSGTMTSL